MKHRLVILLFLASCITTLSYGVTTYMSPLEWVFYDDALHYTYNDGQESYQIGFGTNSPTAGLSFFGDYTQPKLLKFSHAAQGKDAGFYFDGTNFSSVAAYSKMALKVLQRGDIINENNPTISMMVVASRNISLGYAQAITDVVNGRSNPPGLLHISSGNVYNASDNSYNYNGYLATYINRSDVRETVGNCGASDEDLVWGPETDYNAATNCTFPKRWGTISTDGENPVIVDQYGNTITFGAEFSDVSSNWTLSAQVNDQTMYLEIWNPSYNATASFTKNFIIDHPSLADHYLIHTSMEGPSSDVAYYGQSALIQGKVTVTLPPYFEALVAEKGRTIHLTPIDGFDPLAIKQVGEAFIKEGKFTVHSNVSDSTQAFLWEVKGIRKDSPQFEVEPLKKDIKNVGFGPYGASGGGSK